MPRPKKCRRVCFLPDVSEFYPAGGSQEAITLTVDEYETIRLIDREKFSQEECAGYMQVARTTVQQIYDSARGKLADALVLGLGIRIAGGDYRLCERTKGVCCLGGCRRQKRVCSAVIARGMEETMKIAVTYENGQVFQHFGHTEQFKIYTVEDGKITSAQVVDTNGSGHGALAGFLSGIGAEILICGGIGGGAQMALAAAGIRLFGGVSGDADQAVESFLAGQLAYDPDARCDHHEHHGEHSCGGHQGEDHPCGEHHCGEPHGGEHHCGAHHCGE